MTPRKDKIITVKIPGDLLELMDDLAAEDFDSNRSALMIRAIRDYLDQGTLSSRLDIVESQLKTIFSELNSLSKKAVSQ